MKITFYIKKHSHLIFVNIAVLVMFVFFTYLTISDHVFKIDSYFFENVQNFWSPSLTTLMIILTNFASPLVLGSLSLFVYIYLAIRRCAYYDLLFAFSMFFSLISYALIKVWTHVARPEFALTTLHDWSFPSGHMTMTTTFILVLLYSFKNQIKSVFLKNMTIILGFLFILAMGTSRIYLAVHRPSEVIAGFLLGVFSVTLWVLILSYFHHHRDPKSIDLQIL